MLLCAVLFPLLAGVGLSLLRLERRQKHVCYAAAALGTDVLGICALLWGREMRLFSLAPGLRLLLSLDSLGRFFLLLVLLLYTLVCFYSFSYLEIEEREDLFFAFYFVSFAAMLALCMAGNLLSLYLFFELVTLTSMPLVLHERSREAVAAALKYLFYSIGGALLGLLALIFLCTWGQNSGTFLYGGFLTPEELSRHGDALRLVVFGGIVGFGAKAGMYPLHGWLPSAHPVAPAPASALLSGIVAKAGLLGVIRLVYFSAGPELLRGSWVQTAWISLALCTVLMGSMMAFREKVLKKRLAYSTVSQLSYVMLGLALLSPAGLQGGLTHIAAHAVSKSTLFLCAGVFIYRLGLREVGELKGQGRNFPLTFWCFLLASLSLVGIPPMGGFLSKWRLAGAALGEAPGVFSLLIPVVLMISALLTAGYLLPVAVDAFFPEEGFQLPRKCREAPAGMTAPMCLLCLLALGVGLLFRGDFVS